MLSSVLLFVPAADPERVSCPLLQAQTCCNCIEYRLPVELPVVVLYVQHICLNLSLPTAKNEHWMSLGSMELSDTSAAIKALSISPLRLCQIS